MSVKQSLKRALFHLVGKDPDAVVAAFLSGDPDRARAMSEEFRSLVPDRKYFEVGPQAGSAWQIYRRLRRQFRRWRIGQAAVLFDGTPPGRSLRWAAFLLAPGRILAYNAGLERHHLRLRSWIASWLFVRGVALDRIFLRPWWLCPWKRDRSTVPEGRQILEGRPLASHRQRVAVLSPYFPYPLSHGGAVRIYHLLREAARRFDILLFAFTEGSEPLEAGPVLEFCAKVILVPKPRYREPRWSSLAPPEVCEYRSPAMRRVLEEVRREYGIELLQVEYTQLAEYCGDILVEHDVTFDLYEQVQAQRRTISSWWDLWRWRRFERHAVKRYRRAVAMSAKDAALLDAPHVLEIPNGVDLERFRPVPETEGQKLLFIGSFRHFPNVIAYRFFTEQVWPLVQDEFPGMKLTVVTGPDAMTYWRAATGSAAPALDPRIRLLEFVREVRPLYEDANLVLVPTLVSAGTNVKVLEAMAMGRAVVSTSSGCAGLGLEHGTSVWVGDTPEEFAQGVRRLIRDKELRWRIALMARRHAEQHFGWRSLGFEQRRLWAGLLGPAVMIRRATTADLEAIGAIQNAVFALSAWTPESYLQHACLVGVVDGRVAGFVAWRQIGEGELEILNLAVEEGSRRRGAGRALVEEALAQAPAPGSVFLEVRASNLAARKLYEGLGFQQSGLRRGYYHTPPEDGIVMRFQSC